MELVLPPQDQEVLETLGDGRHQLVLNHGILPDHVAAAIQHSLAAAIEVQISPDARLLHAYYAEFDFLNQEREVLLGELRQLGRQQKIVIFLACAVESLHGLIAAVVGANDAKLAVTVGSATALGGTFTAVLRYLAKERASTRSALSNVKDSTADLLFDAQPMTMLPQFSNQPEGKFKSIVQIYTKRRISR